MKTFAIVAIAGVVAALGAIGGAEAKGRCVMAGGQGVGIGTDVAQQVARESLAEALTKGKLKGKGKISYKCESTGLTSCIARQQACG